MVGQNVTANGGKWQVCGLVPGNYTVSEILQPNWKNVTALNQNVTLGCENRTDVDFRNTPLMCISGRKVNDCTGAGISGWTITVRNSTGGIVGTAVTAGTSGISGAPRGFWQVCGLVPGNYSVTRDPLA